MFLIFKNIFLSKKLVSDSLSAYLSIIINIIISLIGIFLFITEYSNANYIIFLILIFIVQYLKIFALSNYLINKKQYLKLINIISSDIFTFISFYYIIFNQISIINEYYYLALIIFLLSFFYRKSIKYTTIFISNIKTDSLYFLSFKQKIKNKIIYKIIRTIFSYEVLAIISIFLILFSLEYFIPMIFIIRYLVTAIILLIDEIFIKKSSFLEKFTTIILLLGLTSIYYLIIIEGASEIWNIFSNLSVWKFLVVIFIYFFVFLLDALSFKYCMHQKDRKLSLSILVKSFISGSAIKKLTPMAVLGEAVKINFVKDKISVDDFTAYLILWNMLVAFIGIIWNLLVAISLYNFIELPSYILTAIILLILILLLPLGFIILLISNNFFSRLIKLFHRFHKAKERLINLYNKVQLMEKQIINILKTRKWDLFKAALFIISSKMLSLVVSYLRLWILDIDINIFDVLFICNMQSLLLSVLMFIPSGIGVAEIFDKYMFELLGLSSSQSLAIPLVFRVIQIILTIFGFTFIISNRIKNLKNNI